LTHAAQGTNYTAVVVEKINSPMLGKFSMQYSYRLEPRGDIPGPLLALQPMTCMKIIALFIYQVVGI